MKSTLAFLVLLYVSALSWAQTPIWQENFNNGCSLSCLGNAYSGINGLWTETVMGVQGSNPNKWYVSCAESNTGIGNCSGNCSSTSNETLHIGMNGGGTNPSCTTGDCGASYALGPSAPIDCNTNVRIESPTINLSAYSNLILTFSYIEGGEGSTDNATLWFYDGAVWTLIGDPTPTTSCTAGSSTWSIFTVALPASANNNPNVKLGFIWVNNDDNSGNSVSFAVDEIKLTLVPPVADFTANQTTICQNNCITFSNTSTFSTNASFLWDFGNGQTSNLENPGAVCYNTSGSYTVSLTVTDNNGTDTQTSTNFINVTSGPNAGSDNTSTACNNTTLNLSALLIGADPGGTWQETTVPSSGRLNPSNATFDPSCLSPGTFTFNYVVSSAGCSDTASITLNIISCGGPTAGINATSLTGCIGQSIIFSDNSCGTNINSWLWSFGGGTPGTANTQGPHSIVFNTPGVYNILLVVTDANGTDNQTIQVTISGCGAPVAAFNLLNDTICHTNCVTFDNNSTTTGTSTYSWVFEGGTPETSNAANPGEICYDTLSLSGGPVTLPVTLTVTNTFGTSTFTQNITVVSPPTITACCEAIVEMGALVGLSANASEGTVTWTWVPDGQGDIVDCITSNCDSVNAYPIITTDFIATTTTEFGCQESAIVKVLVDYETAIGVPNTFSPNGNDINDVLRVKGIGISDLDFKIYNRYGQLVFETTKVDNEWQGPTGWDGTFKGKPEQNGTFLYMLNYTLISGESGFLSGNVTLIR
jgi:gliding motility-associated-like protein